MRTSHRQWRRPTKTTTDTLWNTQSSEHDTYATRTDIYLYNLVPFSTRSKYSTTNTNTHNPIIQAKGNFGERARRWNTIRTIVSVVFTHRRRESNIQKMKISDFEWNIFRLSVVRRIASYNLSARNPSLCGRLFHCTILPLFISIFGVRSVAVAPPLPCFHCTRIVFCVWIIIGSPRYRHLNSKTH